VRARVDARPRRTGQWFLTGSQEAPLMREVSEGRRRELYYFRDEQVIIWGQSPKLPNILK